MVNVTDEAERARLREFVRRGYDAISCAYCSEDGGANASSSETTTTYAGWIEELAALLPAGGSVLDLGCGAGVPAARDLVDRGFNVTGIDISEVQIERAQRLVPGGRFICADMATWDASAGSFDAIISLYALIHVPLADQRALFPRMRRWLVDDGHLLAVVGVGRWTGIESYFGTDMFWDHADTASYLQWLAEAGIRPLWHRFVPEADGGHTLVLARAV